MAVFESAREKSLGQFCHRFEMCHLTTCRGTIGDPADLALLNTSLIFLDPKGDPTLEQLEATSRMFSRYALPAREHSDVINFIMPVILPLVSNLFITKAKNVYKQRAH